MNGTALRPYRGSVPPAWIQRGVVVIPPHTWYCFTSLTDATRMAFYYGGLN